MKTNEEKFQDSLEFVTSHYERGAFSSHDSWVKITKQKTFSWRRRISAAAIACGVLAASAFLYTTLKPVDNIQEKIEDSEMIVPQSDIKKSDTSAKLEFTDASLEEVVNKIEETYGVKISGMPDKDIKLTLSYEGTAEDIIETINETLQIHLVIDKK